jgi:hypothetical protein
MKKGRQTEQHVAEHWTARAGCFVPNFSLLILKPKFSFFHHAPRNQLRVSKSTESTGFFVHGAHHTVLVNYGQTKHSQLHLI